jgi:hypothetical protein
MRCPNCGYGLCKACGDVETCPMCNFDLKEYDHK